MDFIQAVPEDVRNGTRALATLRLRESKLDELAWDGFVNRDAVRSFAQRAAASFAQYMRLRANLGFFGRVSLVDGCEVRVSPRLDEGAGLSFDGFVVISDREQVSLRLKDDLRRAAEQLRLAPSGPRVILLDADGDSALQRPARVVRELMQTEAWSQGIAVVMIVNRSHPYCTIDLVRGQGRDSLDALRLLSARLRNCDRGHLHGEALTTPPVCP
jgi:hypothetical protein